MSDCKHKSVDLDWVYLWLFFILMVVSSGPSATTIVGELESQGMCVTEAK